MATFYRFIPGLLVHYRGPRGDKAPRAIPMSGWSLSVQVNFLVKFWYAQTYEIICKYGNEHLP